MWLVNGVNKNVRLNVCAPGISEGMVEGWYCLVYRDDCVSTENGSTRRHVAYREMYMVEVLRHSHCEGARWLSEARSGES